MLLYRHLQFIDVGNGYSLGWIFEPDDQTANGYVIVTATGSGPPDFAEAWRSNQLTALPDDFRVEVAHHPSSDPLPSPTQTLRMTSSETWTMDAEEDDVTYPSNITTLREIRYSANGAVKGMWLEGERVDDERPVVVFGEDWTSQSTLHITKRTDLTTHAQRAAVADTFLAGLDTPFVLDEAVWAY